MRSRGLLQALVLAGAAAIGSSSFVGAPAGAGVSRHARASSRVQGTMMAYKVPEATQEEWVRGQSGLYEKRISYLGQEIDDLVINQIISLMLFADAEDDTKEQYLYINSPGGSVIAGLALYDTFGHIGSPVITCNIGMAASMASFILGAGERGKRMALPHSRVMIHQPMGGSEGQAEDVRVEAEQIMRIKNTLVTMYAQMTGQTREKLISDLDRDNYMSAQQALDYGLIDKVITGDGS